MEHRFKTEKTSFEHVEEKVKEEKVDYLEYCAAAKVEFKQEYKEEIN